MAPKRDKLYAGLHLDYERLHKEIFTICSDLNKLDTFRHEDYALLISHAYCKLEQMGSIVRQFHRINENYCASLFTSALTAILECSERFGQYEHLSNLVSVKSIFGE